MTTNWSATFPSFSILIVPFQKGNRKTDDTMAEMAEKCNYKIYYASSYYLESLTNTLVFCPREHKYTVKLTKLLSSTALVKISN